MVAGSAQAFGKRVLSDARVGHSRTELVAQKSYSERMVRRLRGSWRVAPRHRTCWAHVPWARVCDRARRRLFAHRWLYQLAAQRLARMDVPTVTTPTGTMSSAQASWYGPGFYGNRTACGLTLTTGLLGVAHKTMACGTRLLVCYRGRCATATVVDRGPYVGGREFDLTGGLAVALGFGGVDTVSYAVTG